MPSGSRSAPLASSCFSTSIGTTLVCPFTSPASSPHLARPLTQRFFWRRSVTSPGRADPATAAPNTRSAGARPTVSPMSYSVASAVRCRSCAPVDPAALLSPTCAPSRSESASSAAGPAPAVAVCPPATTSTTITSSTRSGTNGPRRVLESSTTTCSSSGAPRSSATARGR